MKTGYLNNVLILKQNCDVVKVIKKSPGYHIMYVWLLTPVEN